MKTLTLIAGIAIVLSVVDAGAAERFRPATSDYVVLHVPARTANDPIAILEQRNEGAREQGTAVALAALYIERARQDREQRYFGRAEMLVQPWLARADVLPATLRVQADILQNRHDFAGAMRLLDRAVERSPRDAGARLMRASVKMVQGHSMEARTDCAAVLASGESLAGAVCLAEVLGNTGKFEQAESLLKSQLARDGAAPMPRDSNGAVAGSTAMGRESAGVVDAAVPVAIRGWALWLQADFADRRGDARAAENYLREALKVTPANEGVRSALCDVLIARGALEEAFGFVNLPAPSTGLLVRRARIQKLLGDPGLKDTRSRLFDLLSLASRRGEPPHLREETILALDVDGDAERGLELAKANFETQRETVDARLLVRAAQARGDRDALALVADWMRDTGFQDQRIAGTPL